MTKKDINEYLYYEFGIDGDKSFISGEWPFHLHSVGSLTLRGERTDYYEFTDGETDYYAQEGFFFLKAGMTLEDISIQDLGQQWIDGQNPLDLNTTVIGDDQVPTTLERRYNIEALARKALGDNAVFNIVEGLFLRKTGSYIAILENSADGNAIVVGTDLNPITIGFPEASSYRRLSYALGKLLRDETIL